MDDTYQISLDIHQIKMLRWALRVASNSIAASSQEGNFDKDDAVRVIAELDALDALVVNE